MMSKINEKSTLNVKLTVKPILFTMYHIHAYMGPCRYGEGYALTTAVSYTHLTLPTNREV